jgi:hypothetical protein
MPALQSAPPSACWQSVNAPLHAVVSHVLQAIAPELSEAAQSHALCAGPTAPDEDEDEDEDEDPDVVVLPPVPPVVMATGLPTLLLSSFGRPGRC